MLFFSQEISALNKEYSTLLGGADEDDEEKGKEKSDDDGEGEGDREESDDNERSGFVSKWGWYYIVNQIADLVHESWGEVMGYGIIEFLNLYSYIRDKNTWENAAIEQYKKRH